MFAGDGQRYPASGPAGIQNIHEWSGRVAYQISNGQDFDPTAGQGKPGWTEMGRLVASQEWSTVSFPQDPAQHGLDMLVEGLERGTGCVAGPADSGSLMSWEGFAGRLGAWPRVGFQVTL